MPNRLATETSPYLLQHAENPVDWYPWGDAALAAARERDLPILLSIGYSACHWCHVMAHESFEDVETAALMNQLFISIKVDREERPDLDGIYMQAVQALSGHGGWPMTVFLTPDARPYFGGTYFPRQASHGMPDFCTVLRAAAEAFHERRDAVDAAADQVRAYLAPPRLGPAEGIEIGQLEVATEHLLNSIDWSAGGFGAAPKFPHAAALDLLLSRWHTTADPRTWEAVSLSLDRMARGGICDQLGGGFHRYSVDGEWAIPHFEKMLYDNAQLAPVYLHAYQLSGRDRWRQVAEATLDYMARELRLPDGGFAASQDADSPGGEGAFFTWSPQQLEEVLGHDDAQLAAAVFGVDSAGNFEAGTTVLAQPNPIDVVAARLAIEVTTLESRLGEVRSRLLAARALRSAPSRDDKVITSWNALAVHAFAEAGAVLDRGDYRDIARTAAEFLLDQLCPGGVVMRTWSAGRATITGFLEDVAYLAWALLTLDAAVGGYYEQALALAESIPNRFGGDGVLYDTAAGTERLLVRPRTIDDNPLPAGQSVAALLFQRLAALSGDSQWQDRAHSILAPMAAAVARAPLAVATLAQGLDAALAAPQQVAVVGAGVAADTRALVNAAWRKFAPHRALAGVPFL